MPSRRQFLSTTASGLAAASLAPYLTTRAARGQQRQPNILFCISDDQSWLHTSAAGDPVVRTPHFDRVAGEGVLARHAYVSAPSCTPSRGAVLTGQQFCRLREGGNLWSMLPTDLPTYPDLLEAAGYQIGKTRKGWGPGSDAAAGRTRNPAGPDFRSFAEFHAQREVGRPFCFWLGTSDPHRPYEPGSGLAAGKLLDQVNVPACLPDHEVVRSDILDYLQEIERWDSDIGAALAVLEQAGELDQTMVVITSDNGMPFPRAKTNLYDLGVRMPLAIRWPERIPGGRVIDDLISLTDLAPTFLAAAGLPVPAAMTGRDLWPVLGSRRAGLVEPAVDQVFFGRERHTDRRAGGVGYPMRAVRTADWLYVRNFAPERWPAGDPPQFGDIDGGPTKSYLIDHREEPAVAPLFALAAGQRPAEELYHLASDPDQVVNLAAEPARAADLATMRTRLDRTMRELADPRADGGEAAFDSYPYYGGRPR